MAYTEVNNESWFSRLKSSLSGMLIGVALFCGGTYLLWWNEGDFVAVQDSLNEAQQVTTELGDVHQLNPAANGKVVYAAGYADTKDILTDPIFGISENAIALKRSVEYYQWTEQSQTETREKLGGGEETITTYTYSQNWVTKPINSSEFRDPQARLTHGNIILAQIDDLALQAADVTLGAYNLPAFLIKAIHENQPLNIQLEDTVKTGLNQQIRNNAQQLKYASTPSLQLSLDAVNTSNSTGEPNYINTQNNTIYIGSNPSTPTIGDVRITFHAIKPTDISLIAKLNGNTFETWRASNDKEVYLLELGIQSAENLYGTAHDSNKTRTWILRLVGTLIVFLGLKTIAAPLRILASVIPPLGSVVGFLTGVVCFLIGIVWSLLIIAIAWLRFRPLIGICVLSAAVLLIVLLIKLNQKKQHTGTAIVES